MKNLSFFCLGLGLIPLSLGCSLANNPDLLERQKDIKFFVKEATRIALHETSASDSDVAILKSYVTAAQGLLMSQPDISALRELVIDLLPQEHHLVALTVLDVIERYVLSVLEDPEANQAAVQLLIKAGLDGAMAALNER